MSDPTLFRAPNGTARERVLLAFGQKFEDGSFLLVAEDSFRVVEAQEAIVRAFVAAFALIIVLGFGGGILLSTGFRSEEHTSELQSLMRISYAVFCVKKKKYAPINRQTH